MDPPPQNLLNPWDIARKKKKQKTPNVGGFFKKKNESQVREEQEAADARAAAAQADADARQLEATHKFNLLVEKWELPPRPSLVRGTGAGRTKVAVIWVVGLYDLAEQVAKGKILEPSRIILPPANAKKAANLISWKHWRMAHRHQQRRAAGGWSGPQGVGVPDGDLRHLPMNPICAHVRSPRFPLRQCRRPKRCKVSR